MGRAALPQVIHLKLGMKMPAGTVFEIERLVPVGAINIARDGHAYLAGIVREMTEQFLDTLPREQDAR